MCRDCERIAEQRDRYMRQMERAVEEEAWARSRHARLLDDVELLEGDREALMTLNAELLVRAERAERLLKRWRPRRDSNLQPTE